MNYIISTVRAVFAVKADRDLYAVHLSCGHTNMHCHIVSAYFIELRRSQLLGKPYQCYKKHDGEGKALPAASDTQQEADERYFSDRQQCMVCGAEQEATS